MWPDRVSNPGRLTYESGALSTALRGPAPAHNGHTGTVLLLLLRARFLNIIHPVLQEKVPFVF